MQPLRSGFRLVFRQPALILAEISWRWSFGAAACFLAVFAIRWVLAGIDISRAEYLLARRSDAFLIADACARILYQVLPSLARAATILVPALALIWILAATFGRAATLRALINQSELLRPRRESVGPGALAGAASEVPENTAAAGAHTRGKMNMASLLALNFLRAFFTLATLLAFVGAMILTGVAFPARGADPTTAVVIWIILAALVTFFWSFINWFLALAPIWIVRDGRSPLQAIGDSVALLRRQPAAYLSAGCWLGFVRALLLAALLAAIFAASALETTRAVAGLSLVTALVYFALADFLYIARLGAYVALADEGPQPSAVSIQPLVPAPQPLPAAEQ